MPHPSPHPRFTMPVSVSIDIVLSQTHSVPRFRPIIVCCPFSYCARTVHTCLCTYASIPPSHNPHVRVSDLMFIFLIPASSTPVYTAAFRLVSLSSWSLSYVAISLSHAVQTFSACAWWLLDWSGSMCLSHACSASRGRIK
ncbi:hypothetical protein LXA43DRAFT_511993 [Ganoderma leucocontextum]|nr:hypothetical protein LXA43DRAFT_511993 [Ganoderma leucocontextum]